MDLHVLLRIDTVVVLKCIAPATLHVVLHSVFLMSYANGCDRFPITLLIFVLSLMLKRIYSVFFDAICKWI